MSISTLPLSQLTALSSPHKKHALAPANLRAELKGLLRSILRHGLMNPILIAREHSKIIVLDGRKRLWALQLLMKKNRLPRSLAHVPVTQCPADITPHKPGLLSEAEIVKRLIAAQKKGQSALSLGLEMGVDTYVVTRALSLRNLHPQIMDYFNAGHISMDQAAAFATMPNQDAQWRLLLELGPFARAKEVIAAILDGQTVIETPDGNVHILPSRSAATTSKSRPLPQAA